VDVDSALWESFAAYLGCWWNIDQYGTGIVPFPLSTDPSDLTMTPENCVRLARNQGYRYAGLVDGYGCWGGTEYPFSQQVSSCIIPCRGGYGTCGGHTYGYGVAVDVYDTGALPFSGNVNTSQASSLAPWQNAVQMFTTPDTQRRLN
jgi:WSC domain